MHLRNIGKYNLFFQIFPNRQKQQVCQVDRYFGLNRCILIQENVSLVQLQPDWRPRQRKQQSTIGRVTLCDDNVFPVTHTFSLHTHHMTEHIVNF